MSWTAIVSAYAIFGFFAFLALWPFELGETFGRLLVFATWPIWAGGELGLRAARYFKTGSHRRG